MTLHYIRSPNILEVLSLFEMRCAAGDVNFSGELVLAGVKRFAECIIESALRGITVGSAVEMLSGFAKQHYRRIK